MLKRLLIVIVLLVGISPVRAQEPCEVPQAYIQEFRNHAETLENYREEVGPRPQDVFGESGLLVDMAGGLREMRIYHEDATDELPFCAAGVNWQMIEAISALEDFVMAGLMAELKPRGQVIIEAGHALIRFDEKMEGIAGE